MKLYLEKTARAIRPATDEDADKLRRVPNGDLLPVSIRGRRNGRLFRKWHLLVKRVAENHPSVTNVEAVKLEFKVRAGRYDEHITAYGEVVYIPRSIAYDECEPADFAEFYEKCVRIALVDMLGCMTGPDFDGMDREDLDRYLDVFIGGEDSR